MKKPKILDLFCGAGGASMGYHLAGFEVVGVDINPQPHYPFEFHREDAFDFFNSHWRGFNAFHASPKCQGHTKAISIHKKKPWFNSHESSRSQIPKIRNLFNLTDRFWVIENVPNAPLIDPIKLRGNLFGLGVIRDRLFETNFYLPQPILTPIKKGSTNSHRGLSTGGDYICVAGHNFLVSEARIAMDIPWMNQKELAQAIPPAYTKWIGEHMIKKRVDSAP
jgi:DNA (cytosine-5)-methyltransferase 1